MFRCCGPRPSASCSTSITAPGSRDGHDRHRRSTVWLWPHRPDRRAARSHRRGAGCHAGRATDQGINAGIYAFDLGPLFDALEGIAAQNAQGEYYLTDLIAIYHRRKLTVETMVADNPVEIRGINSRTELAEVSRLVRQNKNEELMAAGVTIVDPGNDVHRS
jgi:hypothetical protein